MGKEKTAKKDYSAGSGKRWSVFLGIIVLVAIIVVVIILAIPPNTYNAVETLNRASASTYLSSENEKVEFNRFKAKVNSSVVSAYTQEVYDYEILAQAIDEVLDFHNNYLVFANNNKTFKKNYKNIKKTLNDVKDSQSRLNDIIKKTNKLSEESSSYIQNAMVDFRKEYIKWLKYIEKSTNALKNVYNGSLGNVTFNNQASKLILNTTSDYLSVIINDYNTLSKEDVKKMKIEVDKYLETYKKLGLTAKIKSFNDFVNRNIVLGENDIVSVYYFDENVKTMFAQYDDFFNLYNQSDLKAVIESMVYDETQTNVLFTIVFEDIENIEDKENVAVKICQFIVGGN